MRRLFALCLCAVPGLFACSQQDPPPHFIDVSYQLRCIDCTPLAVDENAHKVLAIDGENNFDVRCTAQGSGPLLTFSVAYSDKKHPANDYSIKVDQASLAGRNPGKSCSVVVTEASNSYQGTCTADEPTDDAPCQLKMKQDGQNVSGSLYCKHIPNRSNADFTRYVVKPGTNDPLRFEVDGCEGL